MADQEEEDLRMALRMSMQNSPPEPKRSKPRDAVAGGAATPVEGSSEVKSRQQQRELMAAAAEKRMLLASAKKDSAPPPPVSRSAVSDSKVVKREKDLGLDDLNLGRKLTEAEANELFSMVFGAEVSKGILAQWSNQGIR